MAILLYPQGAPIMPYERKQEVLQSLIDKALADESIRDAIQQNGLRPRDLSRRLIARQEEVWNTAGGEIETYNRNEAAVQTAEGAYQKQLEVWLGTEHRLGKGASFAFLILIFIFTFIIIFGLIFAPIVYLGLDTVAGFHFFSSSDQRLTWSIRIAATAVIALVGLFALILGVGQRARRSRTSYSADLRLKYDFAGLRAAAETAGKAIDDAVLKLGVLPLLRQLINESLAPSYATEFPDIEPRGLDQLHGAVFKTTEWDRLTDMLQTMEGGSIGLAGPRGAGKSTMLRWFCGERSWMLRERQVLSVLVPAPADYEIRDFILYLYYAVCRRILQINQIDVEQIRWNPNPAAAARPLLSTGLLINWRVYLYTLGVALLTLGLLTAATKTLPDAASPAAVSAAAIATATTAQGVSEVSPTSEAPPPPGKSSNDAVAASGKPSTPPSGGTANGAATTTSVFGAALHTVRILAQFAAALGLTAGGLCAGGIVLLLLASGAELLLRRELARHDAGAPQASQPSLDDLLRDQRPLVADAMRRLQVIKFQQSYTAGWSGSLKFPIVEGGLKQDLSMSERPLSLPEIVASFCGFLERLAREYWVLIGIDELDKIHPEENAEKFLNDIKIIFGLQGVFYLVSISENALSSFERRGIPIRNVFDSCFDDVMYIGYLNFSSACGVLRQRVIGTPHPFLFLCYCISGGLPRDLVRVCRNLIIEAQDPGRRGRRSLAELCLAIAGADLLAKLHANEVVASEIPLEQYVLDFLQELQSLRNAIARAIQRSDPQGLAAGLKRSSQACLRPLSKLRAADDVAKKAFADLKQLRYELGVYLAYVSIILTFFAAQPLGESEFTATEDRGFFDDVVKIRQSLALNPSLAEVLAKQLADSLQNTSANSPAVAVAAEC